MTDPDKIIDQLWRLSPLALFILAALNSGVENAIYTTGGFLGLMIARRK